MAAPLQFSVTRRQPVLVSPAKPTPYEFKDLSDIDDQDGLRFQIPIIQFYRNNPAMHGRDPASVIKDALAKALVFYYPFAGRLRERSSRKLTVECTGEGVLFIEADADVRLEQFGDALQPPFPCWEELLYDVPGSGGVTDCPLLLIQVTRLKCGGFIFALRLNHTMADAPGLIQFMSAIGEIAQGSPTPSVLPVWQREVLNARNPPQVSFAHREYDQVPDTKGTLIPLDDMAHQSLFFGPDEMSAIRKHVPPHLSNSSNFDILTACLWRCRTIAIHPDPDEEVRIICIANARGKLSQLPKGYYGNAFAFPVAVTTAEKLSGNPLGYAVDLVRKAKGEVTAEYMKSVADFMVQQSRPHFAVVRVFLVSDLTRAGFGSVDFGWGEAVYGGAAKGGVGAIPGVASFYIKYRNKKGQDGVVVPFCLPGPAMDRFIVELQKMLRDPVEDVSNLPSPHFILSAL